MLSRGMRMIETSHPADSAHGEIGTRHLANSAAAIPVADASYPDFRLLDPPRTR
jgi:hypothetical protein